VLGFVRSHLRRSGSLFICHLPHLVVHPVGCKPQRGVGSRFGPPNLIVLCSPRRSAIIMVASTERAYPMKADS
jgi:hypothetical protein